MVVVDRRRNPEEGSRSLRHVPSSGSSTTDRTIAHGGTSHDRATLADFPRVRSVKHAKNVTHGYTRWLLPLRPVVAATVIVGTIGGDDILRRGRGMRPAGGGNDARDADKTGPRRDEREKRRETRGGERNRCKDRIAGDREERWTEKKERRGREKERKGSTKKSSETGVRVPVCAYIGVRACTRANVIWIQAWAVIGTRSAETLRERRSAAAMFRWTIYFCPPLAAPLCPLRSVYSMPTTTERRSSTRRPLSPGSLLLLLQRRNVLSRSQALHVIFSFRARSRRYFSHSCHSCLLPKEFRVNWNHKKIIMDSVISRV